MDRDRFDALSRLLAARVGRRGLGLTGLALAARLPGLDDVAARPKRKKTCKNGTVKCGKTCSDTRIDNAHCGSCDHACGNGEHCQAGTCVSNGSTCNPACPADRPCHQGKCTCASDGQCQRDRDPDGNWCVVNPPGRPDLGWCGCPRDFTVCALGEACSACCSDEFCRARNPDTVGIVCPAVPGNSYWGKTCCVDNGSPCSSDSHCCSNNCNENAGVCECAPAGISCGYGRGCCSGVCSASTRKCAE